MNKPIQHENQFVSVPSIQVNPVFLFTPYNHDRDHVSFASGLHCIEPSMAVQSAKDECDINTIVRRFGLTGKVPVGLRAPTYDDFSGIGDFHTCMNALAVAHEAFDQLPSNIRDRFNNDPGSFVDFCSDESNRDEAVKLGLIFPSDSEPDKATKSEE